MSTRRRQSRGFRPGMDNTLDQRLLMSVAVDEVLNRSSYTITAQFRWTSSSSWTTFTEAPGQGRLFWAADSGAYQPQVRYCSTTWSSSQTTNVLIQGYGHWSGSGTPPTSAASLYQFQTTTAGVQLYYGAAPKAMSSMDHPAAATTYSQVSAPLFRSSGPSYVDVDQGAVGDCSLLASLAAVAARYPNKIRDMFTYDGATVENGKAVGLYTVRLFDRSGVAKYIPVDTMLPSGGNYYDHPNGVLWVALAEKAFAQANGAGWVTTAHIGSDSYAAIGGLDPSWALWAITGKSAGTYAVNPNDIASAWKAGEVIVLGSSDHPSSPYIVGDSDGTHAYAVVGYNPSSSMPFKVFNLWGTYASGWALGTFHGHQAYGLFNAGGGFLAQNFYGESLGYGAAPGAADRATAPAQAARPADPAPVVSIGPRTTPSAPKATIVVTPVGEVVTMIPWSARRLPLQARTRHVA